LPSKIMHDANITVLPSRWYTKKMSYGYHKGEKIETPHLTPDRYIVH
jgi:hypothetical protein